MWICNQCGNKRSFRELSIATALVIQDWRKSEAKVYPEKNGDDPEKVFCEACGSNDCKRVEKENLRES